MTAAVFYHTTRRSRPNGVSFGKKLTLRRLFQLRDGDVLIFDRLAPLLCWAIEYVIQKNIRVVYVSDGALSSLQEINGRGLFVRSFIDCYVIDQPDVDQIFQSGTKVINLMVKVAREVVPFESDSLHLVLANNPYLGLSKSEFFLELRRIISVCAERNLKLIACYGRSIPRELSKFLIKKNISSVQYLENCPENSFFICTASSAVLKISNGASRMMSEKLNTPPFEKIGCCRDFTTFTKLTVLSRQLKVMEIIDLDKVSHFYGDYFNIHFVLRFLKDLILLVSSEKRI